MIFYPFNNFRVIKKQIRLVFLLFKVLKEFLLAFTESKNLAKPIPHHNLGLGKLEIFAFSQDWKQFAFYFL